MKNLFNNNKLSELNRIDSKKSTLTHITIRLLETKDKIEYTRVIYTHKVNYILYIIKDINIFMYKFLYGYRKHLGKK